MSTPRPFLAMLLNAYEQGGISAPLVVVMSPSDEDLPSLADLRPSEVQVPARAVFDDGPTEPNRRRHPLSSSDEPPRAKNAIALYVDRPKKAHPLRMHPTTGLRDLAPRSEVPDTDEDLSLTDVRASLLPLVVGVSTSVPSRSGLGHAHLEADLLLSRVDEPGLASTADLSSCDLPTWRLPSETVVLDDALLRVLSRAEPAPLHLVPSAGPLVPDLDETDPLLCVTFSSSDDDRKALDTMRDPTPSPPRANEIRSSPLATDDADGAEIARSLFRSAVHALATGERDHARVLLSLATMHDPSDPLLACALSTLGGPPVRSVDDGEPVHTLSGEGALRHRR